ncbi:MAG: glycine cleavage system protein GcvH [Ferruginibacter sp.]
MNFPDNLRYTKDHEWIRMDGDIAVVGITAHAQDQLGDIVYVEMPKTGETFSAESAFGTVEAVKTVSDLLMPVTGTITACNDALSGKPELVNSDPYGDGWMVKMTVSNPADIDKLMTAEQYAAYVA